MQTHHWWEARLECDAALREDLGALIVDGGATACQTEQQGELIGGDSSQLIAFFNSDLQPDSIETILFDAAAMLGIDNLEVVDIALRNDPKWQTRWQASFQPLYIDDICVHPPWESPSEDKDIKYPIVIDPGMAFGTGQHATTQLCLQQLRQHLPAPEGEQAKTLLDVGCGSGILSILAAQLGWQVLATDNDPICLSQTPINAKLNHVHQKITTAAPENVEGTFVWVCANILDAILLELAPTLSRWTAPEGHLLLSGITLEREAEVTERYASLGFDIEERNQLGHWVALLCRKTH